MNRFYSSLFAVGGLIAFTGCQDLAFEAVTTPPTTGVAELDATDQRIKISDGIALGIACTSATCNEVTAESDDASIAMVRSASTDYLRDEFRDGDQPAAIFVVVGVNPGTTTLRFSSPEADATYDIEVVPR